MVFRKDSDPKEIAPVVVSCYKRRKEVILNSFDGETSST